MGPWVWALLPTLAPLTLLLHSCPQEAPTVCLALFGAGPAVSKGSHIRHLSRGDRNGGKGTGQGWEGWSPMAVGQPSPS